MNTYLDQRREHRLDKASGHDRRINTNVAISKNIEDKEREDEFIHRDTQKHVSHLCFKYIADGVFKKHDIKEDQKNNQAKGPIMMVLVLFGTNEK